MEKFFLAQIKHKIKDNAEIWEKGIVIKNTADEALQSFHAYLGAYAYGHDVGTDYVCCEVTDINCNRIDWKRWGDPKEPEPEPDPDENGEKKEQGEKLEDEGK